MKPAPQREEALFQAANQLTGPARAMFLDGACHGDPALRQRLEALLAAHEASAGVLGDEPVREVLAPTLDLPEPVPDEAVGMTLGRYKLREKLGEGGCGTVYVAEQTEPVRRKVALKVIKLGMDTREVIARFEAERQALAMMDHPNIAKVLDAGTTDAGRPFFVMELVRGIKITDYCDQANLSTKERLDLFIKVCQAIQHAHQKGIIHRDIKPGNILVTMHDGVPVPKVIDFGIAKATEGRLVDATVYTQLQQFMGTPAYMSPEQAEMSGLDVDTRSDIYSLGVLLYQLLTSKTPFDGKELLSMGVDAMRKTIREKEPVRPSTRVATLLAEELTTTAKRRSSDAPKLIHQLKGDLDWIVMKALEKDRTRRYDTANGLAMDITRYLTNEPVVARPPSTAYRVQKFVRRNRLPVTAGAVVAITLIVGVVLSSLGFVQARLQRNRAVASAADAKSRQAEAEASDLMARQNAYVADMNLAEVAYSAGNLGRTRELLEGTRPQPGAVELRDWEWRYLWRGCRSDALFTLGQQFEQIRALSFSPDGQQLAVGESDGRVALWNVAVRKEIKVIEAKGHAGLAAFSPRGDLFACAAEENSVTLWNAKTWTAQAHLVTGGLKALAFSGDGTRLATLSRTTNSTLQAQLWNVATASLIQTFHAGVLPVAGDGGVIALSSDGSAVAVGETDSRIQVWDSATGKTTASFIGHNDGAITALAISPDDKILASGSGYTDGTVKLWGFKTGRPIASLTNHLTKWIAALAFSPDGKRLASGSEDQTIRIWDVNRTEQTEVLRGQWSGIRSLAFLADGRMLASGGKDGAICFWNVGSKPREKTFVTMELGGLPARRAPLRRAAFTPDSQSILALDRSKAVVRWDSATGLPTGSMSIFGTNNLGLLFSPTGRLLVVADSVGHLKIWDWERQREVTNFAAHAGWAYPWAFNADGSQFISTGGDGIQRLWELPTWRPIFSRPEPSRENFSAWSLDGRTLVRGFGDGTMQFSDFATSHTQALFKAHQTWAQMYPAFSPDGKLIASASEDGTLKLWDAVTRTNVATMRGLASPHSMAFAPNGRRIVTGSGDESCVYLWDAVTHRIVMALPGNRSLVRCVQFSPDGNALMAINEFGVLHLWRAPSWEEIEAAEAEEKRGLPR